MKNIMEFCEELEKQLLSLSPEELLKSLIEVGFKLPESVKQVKRKNPDLSAEEVCRLIKNQTSATGEAFTKEEAREALLYAEYSEDKVTDAIRKVYGGKSYAAVLKDNGYLAALHVSAYQFGKGDFTLEAWIKAESAGTLIACKGAPGGYGNGGFLLVYNENGSFKLATDDGMGFYEAVTDDRLLKDEAWHHILGLRRSGILEIHLDFKMCKIQTRTNRYTPLDVNNSQPLTLGMTKQYQEPFQYYKGAIEDVRIWNTAKSYSSLEEYEGIELNGKEAELCGWWNFDGQNGTDSSSIHNEMNAEGDVSYIISTREG